MFFKKWQKKMVKQLALLEMGSASYTSACSVGAGSGAGSNGVKGLPEGYKLSEVRGFWG